jgi:hypothetical protein
MCLVILVCFHSFILFCFHFLVSVTKSWKLLVSYYYGFIFCHLSGYLTEVCRCSILQSLLVSYVVYFFLNLIFIVLLFYSHQKHFCVCSCTVVLLRFSLCWCAVCLCSMLKPMWSYRPSDFCSSGHYGMLIVVFCITVNRILRRQLLGFK